GTNPDIKLALYRLIASVHHKLDDEDAMQQAISQRTALLRSVGQTHQADMEDQLGSILFAEADGFASTVLSGVADQERNRSTTETVLADVLICREFYQISQWCCEETIELIEQVVVIQRRQIDEGLHLSVVSQANTQMFLEHLKYMFVQVDEADELSKKILE